MRRILLLGGDIFLAAAISVATEAKVITSGTEDSSILEVDSNGQTSRSNRRAFEALQLIDLYPIVPSEPSFYEHPDWDRPMYESPYSKKNKNINQWKQKQGFKRSRRTWKKK